MAPDHLLCARCGASLKGHAVARGLCPACLLTTALAVDDDPHQSGEPADLIPYRVVTILARGDRGITYFAYPLGSSRAVALKIVGPCNVGAVLSRFARWKDALVLGERPNIARVVDVGPSDEHRVYVASEYVTGRSLDALARRRTLTQVQRIDIVRQIAGALGAAHERKLAHMRLDASRVKIAMSGGLHVTLLGLGASLILDGTNPDPDEDVGALVRMCHELEVSLPRQAYAAADALRADLAGAT